MTGALARSVVVPLRAAPSLEERAATLDRAAQSMTAEEALAAAIDEFRGRIALVSSFGAESATLLHLVAKVDPSTPVFFIDTDKHFVQTNAYREELTHRLGLTDVRL
ncbi:MAG: phosphoadenosine phosphosulfate reductase family protein, partial [Pseudomonadota bacterium]